MSTNQPLGVTSRLMDLAESTYINCVITDRVPIVRVVTSCCVVLMCTKIMMGKVGNMENVENVEKCGKIEGGNIRKYKFKLVHLFLSLQA